MSRDIKVGRTSKGKKEKRGKANVYTLARTDLFETESIEDLAEMLFIATTDRDNTIKNIESLQKHLGAVELELVEIQGLIDIAKQDHGIV